MSRLRELRVHGFKSFAEPTRFVFEPGVNALIGPNGSGKSNMADAVRWVLGEQSNRSLRTRRAEDVIFAGSDRRRPMGMAEVILTLDNADGWLPIDFAEVTVGRRAYRSGESEYLLNGARARLRDVAELLAEGRLAANELVVVGQGTVDAALSLRPEERRQLFEEAAGVKNLQVRRNEASGRLARARDHLGRVSDLVAELRPQVRRLALQAKHQREHDDLLRRARALIVESHRRRHEAGRAELAAARRRAAAAEAELESHRAGDAAARRAVAEAEEQYWEAERRARDAIEARAGTREGLVRCEARLEALTARRGELVRAIEASRDEVAEATGLLAEDEIDEDGIVDLIAGVAEAERAWQAAIARLAAADEELLTAEEGLAAVRGHDAESIAAAARVDEERARLSARLEQLDEELTATADDEVELARRAIAERREAERAEREAAVAKAALEDAQAVLHRARTAAESDRVAAGELAQRAGVVRAELEALREHAEAAGRLGNLLAAAGWPTLIDELDAPAEAWPAIQAVVGGELEQALIWRDPEVAARLTEARGTARLLAPGGPAPDAGAALAAVRADRTLAEWIAAAGELPSVFHRAAVARDVAALLAGWRDLPAGWCAVTPAGDLADSRGLVVLRGRPDGSDAARRHARRRELAEQLRSSEEEHRRAVAAAARTHAAQVEAEKRHARARSSADEAEARSRATAIASREAESAAQQAAARRGELGAARDEARSALAAMASPTVAGADAGRVAAAAGRADAARRARDEAAAQRDAAREAWRTARAAAEGVEGRLAGRRQARSVAEARLAQLGVQLPEQEARLRALEAEFAAARSAAEAARRADDEAAQGIADAEREQEGRRDALRERERAFGDLAGHVARLERELQEATAALSRQEEALAALARERELALEALPGAAGDGSAGAESVPSQPSAADPEVAALDDAELESTQRGVRRTLAQIGSVNPFAVEEHRELAGRLDELEGQDADLREAIAGAEELIGRLDADIAARFGAAFDAIGKRFDEYCKLLFAGGSASLELSERDGEASAGIEIMVRPPGKRLSRLALLSGGERALAGVALLFAMLDVNPVPFCILDEVDAALDEANIGRFADALRRLAERIDFVVITHNRATIEVADTIYGVTMTDAAVSRVLSLRLGDVPAQASA